MRYYYLKSAIFFVKILYKKVQKDKKIPKGAFPFERFCLVMFETQMDEYDKLKKH